MPPTNHQVKLLSVSQRFLALNTFVKQELIITKSLIEGIFRKVSRMTTMKVVVIFVIFGVIDTMVLVITYERIKLEGCACAQIEPLEDWNGWIYPDDAWGQSERSRSAANTAKMTKTAKSYDQKHFSSRCGSFTTYSY